MPQIAQLAATYSSQIFWVLLTFGFVFFVIGLGMVPRIQATVDQRDRQIAGDLAAADAARRAADERDEAYRAKAEANRAEALKLTQAAKAEGAAASEAIVAAGDARNEATIAAAEARIRAATDAALGEIEAVAADAAQEMVARLSGVSVTADEAAYAVKAAMNHG